MHKKNFSVAFAIHSLTSGGAERVMSVLASYFAENGYNVHLINNIRSDNEYPLSSKVKRHYIGEVVNSIRPYALMQRLFRLRQICKHEKIDVLVAFMGMNQYSVYATCGLNTRNVISFRIAPQIEYNTRLKRITGYLLLLFSSGVVFQTQEAKNWFPQFINKKSAIIPNPIWGKFYSIERKVEKGLLVASGRLTSQKNYPMMLRAISHVIKHHNVRLEIYGQGEDEKKLKKQTRDLGLNDYVCFCGRSNNMPEVLSRADVYLLTSDYEGLPNALMEAMAVGLPCVATDCIGGGSKSLIGDNERGILCPVGDDVLFSEAIIRLLNDSILNKQLGRAAKEYAQRFSIENCFKQWEGYINVV